MSYIEKSTYDMGKPTKHIGKTACPAGKTEPPAAPPHTDSGVRAYRFAGA